MNIQEDLGTLSDVPYRLVARGDFKLGGEGLGYIVNICVWNVIKIESSHEGRQGRCHADN
jgi:hypothetical protein